MLLTSSLFGLEQLTVRGNGAVNRALKYSRGILLPPPIIILHWKAEHTCDPWLATFPSTR